MASEDVMQECRDAIDELKTLCETSHKEHRELLIKMANIFDGIFENIASHPNSWKADNDGMNKMADDMKQLTKKVKHLESLMKDKESLMKGK